MPQSLFEVFVAIDILEKAVPLSLISVSEISTILYTYFQFGQIYNLRKQNLHITLAKRFWDREK